ncbi:MAG: creatininase family protein [Alphaproteobacteria bacterium]|nr:creatininase family protein [Alphaproteobacteria bacterium]
MPDTKPEIEWRRLRADQLREKAKENAIVIVPVGSLEQHGPHLPVEVDSLLGETVALRAARIVAEKEPILVTPCLWTGISEHHMSFGGTITLGFPAFSALITDVVHSIVRHGFKRVVLLNGHGGNDNGLRVLADELSPKFNIPILQFTYWYAAAAPIARILETQKQLLHACEAETSMTMHLRPELVARDRIKLADVNTTPDITDVVGGGVYLWRSLASRSSAGVIGNPGAATPEKGERLVADIAKEIAAKLTNKDVWQLPWR